ncbi:hypothetical protein VPH35_029135 [Triticum aestivum]
MQFFCLVSHSNRIWTADRLQHRGWPNCDQCPLCSQVQESAAHLLFKCRFATCAWKEVFSWLDLQVDTTNWHIFTTVKAWWQGIINIAHQRKALSSLIHLVGWEIWKERNARVFRNKAAPVAVIVNLIMEEAALWAIAGAKHLCNVMPRE